MISSLIAEVSLGLVAFNEQIALKIPEDYTEFYIFRPVQYLLDSLQAQNYQVAVRNKKGKLWQVQSVNNPQELTVYF